MEFLKNEQSMTVHPPRYVEEQLVTEVHSSDDKSICQKPTLKFWGPNAEVISRVLIFQN